jgi:hypothetical protein
LKKKVQPDTNSGEAALLNQHSYTKRLVKELQEEEAHDDAYYNYLVHDDDNYLDPGGRGS